MSKLFSFKAEEKQLIADAVKQAEKNTSGEIVPFIVDRSDHYNETPVYAAISAAIFIVIVLNILSLLWLLPFKFDTLNFSVLIVSFMALIYLPVAFIKPLKRMVTNPRKMDNMVNRRALQAFVEEEVFNTRDRTGVLIFISAFEHRVELIADSGITEKTEPDYWQSIVDDLIAGIKNKQTPEALAKAIEECGRLLKEAGFERKPDDTDELSNNLRSDTFEEEK
jgi:putative membrane protein